jgi:hypothetical protein
VQISASSIDSISRKAVDELLPPLTEQLRLLASTSQWPKHIVDSISVECDRDFNLVVHYPEELTTEVEDLEYGGPGQMPNAAIRPFISRSEGVIATVLAEKTINDLFPEMGIM